MPESTVGIKENPLPVEAEGKRVERVLGKNQSRFGKKQT